jgi:hypothetical protein
MITSLLAGERTMSRYNSASSVPPAANPDKSARNDRDLNRGARGKKVANKIKHFYRRSKIKRLLRMKKAKLRRSDGSAILWNLEKSRNSIASVRIQNVR